MSEVKQAEAKPARTSSFGRVLGGILKTVLPLLVLAGAYLLFQGMMATAPEASRKSPERQARLVEVTPAMSQVDVIHIEARGVVRPALRVTLTPQVSGEVVAMSENLVPGGRFEAGDQVLKIDPRDYEYAVEQMESQVTRAQAELTLEEGNQDVAQREYEVLGQELSEADKVLVFRQPQLQTAQAEVAASEAMLRDARLDLERTEVKAPFDALVTMENVDLGSRLGTQTTIAELVGTDTYWVELSIPQSDLRWVVLPTDDAPGSKVYLRHPKVWGPDMTREGHVVRLLPDLSDQGKMARLLVAVDDPLALEAENAHLPKLLIGQYLEAEVIGREVDGAIHIAREHLREGDNIWIMNDAGELEVRPLEILYRGSDTVLASAGVEAGEHIVTTDLATGTAGMPLRTADERAPTAAVEPSTAPEPTGADS
jgi:RND family efflux transporter MFP subunit